MDAFLGEIRVFPYNFAPYSWAACNGQLLSIAQYTALFSIIGTYYGGNGTSNFALPNLQGFTVLSAGQRTGSSDFTIGEPVGSETVTLLQSEIPMHNHTFNGATGGAASRTGAGDNTSYLTNFESINGSVKTAVKGYVSVSANTTLAAQAVGITGNSLPHENRSPFLVMGYFICLNGIFPVRN